MARGLNKAMLIGNVGQDPEIRMTPSGTHVAKISLATNRTFNDRTGAQQERTDWHRLTAFGKLAEIVEQWVRKGDRLFVEGRIEYSQTQNDQGGTRYWTDIVLSEIVMLGSTTTNEEREPRAPSTRSEEERGPAPIADPEDDLPF